MSRHHKWLLALLSFVACLPACERIEERGALPGSSLNFRETVDSVPLTYGRLVGVGAAGENRANVALWFEGNDQTLTAIRVNTSTGTISKEVIVVPRN